MSQDVLCKRCGCVLDGVLHLTGCQPSSNLEGLARRESMSTPAVGAPIPRPTWGQTFMDVADVFSRRATCPRLSVGALLVQEGGIPGPGGYNGARRGAPHCNDVGCDLQMLNGRESCQRAVHAEANAIFNAGRVGFKTGGSTLYVTAAPCLRCVDAIIQAGIIRVVYRDAYGLDGVGLLKAAGVQVEQLSR